MYILCGPHNIKHYTVFQAFAINFSPTKFAYMHEFINSLLWYGVIVGLDWLLTPTSLILIIILKANDYKYIII